jgi:hypothetical protein
LSSVGAFGTTNLTEIAFGGSSGLLSRELIRDTQANPVAFPISADEQLQASYEVRVYPPLNDAQFTVDVSGSRVATVRAIGVTNVSYWRFREPVYSTPHIALNNSSSAWYTGGLNPITSISPQGSEVSSSTGTVSNNAYSAGSYTRSGRYNYSSTQANGTLATHKLNIYMGAFQVNYDPPIAKTSDQTLYLDYQYSWARR